jgi:hypothetical protein
VNQDPALQSSLDGSRRGSRAGRAIFIGDEIASRCTLAATCASIDRLVTNQTRANKMATEVANKAA